MIIGTESGTVILALYPDKALGLDFLESAFASFSTEL